LIDVEVRLRPTVIRTPASASVATIAALVSPNHRTWEPTSNE
jgi:hypothetical protein